MRSLVANGFGYGLLNISTKTNLAPDGKRLVFRQLVGKHRPMVFGVARIKSDYSSRIVTAFADHVRKRVNGTGLPGMSEAPLAFIGVFDGYPDDQHCDKA